MNLLLSRPSGTLSPAEGERDGVRGRWVGSRAQGAIKVRGGLSMKPEEHPTPNIEWQSESSLTSAFEVRCWTFDVFLRFIESWGEGESPIPLTNASASSAGAAPA